jgi:hypothetical protein
MSAQAQPMPDLHFDVSPIQIGDVIMVRMQISDNFGLLSQLIMPPSAAKAFAKYMTERATEAENTLIKPQSMLAPN